MKEKILKISLFTFLMMDANKSFLCSLLTRKKDNKYMTMLQFLKIEGSGLNVVEDMASLEREGNEIIIRTKPRHREDSCW